MQQQTPVRKSNVRKAVDSTPGTECRYLTPAHLKERQSTSKGDLLSREEDVECEKMLLLLGWTLPALTEEHVHHLLQFIVWVRDQMVGVARLSEMVSSSGKKSYVVILRMHGSPDKHKRSLSTFNGGAERMVCDQLLLKDPIRVRKVLDLDFGSDDLESNLVSILLYQMATVCNYGGVGDTDHLYNKFLHAELQRVNREAEGTKFKLQHAEQEAIRWEQLCKHAMNCNNRAGMPVSVYTSMFEQTMLSMADARLMELQQRDMYTKAIQDIADIEKWDGVAVGSITTSR
jgi:hypothetical protein